MSILKYSDFLSEKVIYQLLLESKVVFSEKFINILNKMKDNEIAKRLLNIYSKDYDVQQNYLDISDDKEFLTVILDRKAKEILGENADIYKVINNGRYLTHSDKNNKMFERLGYDKNSQELWIPEVGKTGKILSESISTISGNVYALFQELDGDRKGVLHKSSFSSLAEEDNRLWTSSRNPIRIGKLTRSLLTAANISFIDKDIEEFVNKYKATFDFINDALLRFDIVEGQKIGYWYDQNNYEDGGGTLNNSCMADVSDDYFDIYMDNPKSVRMVIFYDDNGRTDDNGKYTSGTIKGRALLWNITGNSGFSGESYFMDRIYTKNDSDIQLFKQFAEKNGFWYKMYQNSDTTFIMSNGSQSKDADLIIKLNHCECDYYPYLDTLPYLNTSRCELSNNDNNSPDRELRSTGGGYDDIDW
jgi:hypothetical protein